VVPLSLFFFFFSFQFSEVYKNEGKRKKKKATMNLTDPSMALLAASGGDTVKLFDVSVKAGDPCTLSYTPSPGCLVNSVKWNHTSYSLSLSLPRFVTYLVFGCFPISFLEIAFPEFVIIRFCLVVEKMEVLSLIIFPLKTKNQLN
jgi:hypothetical protein